MTAQWPPRQGGSPTAPTSRGPTLLSHPPFRRLWLARLLGQGAQNAILYGLIILVVDWTGNAIHSSLFILSLVLASALFGPWTGLAADRLPKRLVTVVAHALRALLCLAYLQYGHTVWAIYGLNVPFFALSQLQATAEQAAVPALVSQERLATANAFLSLATLGGLVLGAGITAPLLRTVGPDPLLIAAAVVLALAALLSFRVGSMDEERAPGLGREVWQPVQEGWRALRRDSLAFAAAADLALANGAVVVGAALLPIYMVRVLEMNPANAAFVFAPAGLGLLLGLRLSPWLARMWGNGPVSTGGFALFATAFLLLGFVEPLGAGLRANNPLPFVVPFSPAPEVWAVVGLSGPLGFAYSLVNVSARAALQGRSPVHLRGRFMGTQMALGSLAAIPPLLLAGVLAQVVGVRQVAVGTGVVVLAAALYARLKGRPRAALAAPPRQVSDSRGEP